MYLQYVQQPSSSQRHSARLTNAAAAFVAGDSVATGTYVKDDVSAEEQQIVEESVLADSGANGASAVAEAYPSTSAEEAINDESADAAEISESEVPLEDDAAADIPSEDDAEPSIAFAAELPALPEEAANDDEEEADEAQNTPRKVARKPASEQAPLPAGTFFPVDFGGAQGGAIAIANSFSTGVSGSAKSQAIAYGKPESARSDGRRRRH